MAAWTATKFQSNCPGTQNRQGTWEQLPNKGAQPVEKKLTGDRVRARVLALLMRTVQYHPPETKEEITKSNVAVLVSEEPREEKGKEETNLYMSCVDEEGNKLRKCRVW